MTLLLAMRMATYSKVELVPTSFQGKKVMIQSHTALQKLVLSLTFKTRQLLVVMQLEIQLVALKM